jgi:hypothetical protein
MGQSCQGAIGDLESGRNVTESGTKDVSVLNISAGPGVRFVIRSPEKGAVTYNLPVGDMAQFEKALYAVRDFLSK